MPKGAALVTTHSAYSEARLFCSAYTQQTSAVPFSSLLFYLRVPPFQHLLLPKVIANSFSMINVVLSFIFNVVVAVVIFRRVFARTEVNSETIFGALCIYLLVGFIFASVYGLVATLQPNAFFSRSANQPTHRTRPIRFHLLQFWHYDRAWRGWNYCCFESSTFSFVTRSNSRRLIPRGSDRKIDWSLPAGRQALVEYRTVSEASQRSR